VKRTWLALVALLIATGCNGSTGVGKPVVNTVVGSWTLAHVNARPVPTVVNSTSGATGVVVTEHVTISANGTVVDVGTYAPSGNVLLGGSWQPTGQEYTVADTGTCTPPGDGAMATVTFPRTGRHGTISTAGWWHLTFAITGVDPFDFTRDNPK
jgi:hypothetical protein